MYTEKAFFAGMYILGVYTNERKIRSKLCAKNHGEEWVVRGGQEDLVGAESVGAEQAEYW